MDAYFELIKFSNNIRLKTTNENFENCINVINYIKIINKMSVEEKDEKLIHLINIAERDLPFDGEIYSLEFDKNLAKAITSLPNLPDVSYKNWDSSKTDKNIKINSSSFVATDFSFPYT